MDVGVTSLATEIIAARAIAGSMIGILGAGFLAAYFNAHPARTKFGWSALLILVAHIPLFLGPTGLAIIVSRAARDLPTFAAYMAIAVSIVGSLWLSVIGAQVVQNIGARFFGAKAEPIRWWAGDQGKRRRRGGR
jgi:hypothetical protein